MLEKQFKKIRKKLSEVFSEELRIEELPTEELRIEELPTEELRIEELDDFLHLNRFKKLLKMSKKEKVRKATKKELLQEEVKYKESDNPNFLLSNLIFEFVEFGTIPSHNPEELKILTKELKNNADRKSQLLRVTELLHGYHDCLSLRLMCEVYSFLGASYREEGIKYFDIKEEKCGLDGAELLVYLEMLEGEYKFREAEKYYNELIEADPSFQGYYSSLARIMIKQHKIDKAISMLKEARKTKHYEPYYNGYNMNYDFQEVIDRVLSDAIDKKNRGYTYTPRPRKQSK